MFKLKKKLLLTITLLMFSGSNVLMADIIYLKNGRTMEGIIKEESKEKIILDVGFGSISIRKKDIDKVGRSDDREQQGILSKWKEDFYDSERFAPEKHKDLVPRLNDLENKRVDAVSANQKIAELLQKEHDLELKREENRISHIEISKKLQSKIYWSIVFYLPTVQKMQHLIVG